MISAATIAVLEERGLEYVLGVRERTDTLVRQVVLEDRRPLTPFCVDRTLSQRRQLSGNIHLSTPRFQPYEAADAGFVVHMPSSASRFTSAPRFW